MNSINSLKNSFGKLKKNKTKNEEVKIEELIYHRVDKEKARRRYVFEQLSAHVIDVFRALGNLDVRFDFDPFSFDDCRCDFQSSHMINVLCSLKHVPLESIVIVEDDMPGKVMLRLSDGFVDRYDGPCWQDVFTESSSGYRFLDSAKLLQCFSTVIALAVSDVNCVEGTPSVSLWQNNNTNRLHIQLSEGDVYRINLFPSVRVNDLCENFKCLEDVMTKNSKSVLDQCLASSGIHLVARPDDLTEGEFWRITFNDIERKIVLSNAFQCANDSVLLLTMINDFQILGEVKAPIGLPYYHLQMIVLEEIFKHPNRNHWNRKLMQKAMLKLFESLEDCLKKGKCLNVFTGVNLFSSEDPNTLKEKSAKIRRVRERNTLQSLLLAME